MPLPIAIALSLAAAGLKVFGKESLLSEFAQHPLDIAAGHLSGERIVELAERAREWYQGHSRIQNEDLERAVAQSEELANLFCLLDALPQPSRLPTRWSELRNRFSSWLPETSAHGFLSQASEAAIHPALAACEKRLHEIEGGLLEGAEIDPLRLILPELSREWGATLAGVALAALRQEQPNLPERMDTIFEERWFPYLCLAFQDRIKSDHRVSAIFVSLQIATGFVDLDGAIRAFRDESRDFHKRTWELLEELHGAIRPVRAPVNLFASVGSPTPNYVERPELEARLRALLLGGAVRGLALMALQGMGGIGKTELARKLCHEADVRKSFSDGIIWLNVGRESGRTVLDRMKEAAEKLNDDPAHYTTGNCETRYRSLLADKAVLIVLDDVWKAEDVVPFIPDSGRCRLLFTTRITTIAAETGAADCTAELLSESQARAVLADNAAD